MTKTELQKELLEKVKEGIKPSDLKKKNTKIKQDEGYESDSSDKSIPKAPPLPNSQIKDLQTQITSLKKQLQTYKDFKEADLKIKEKYKEEIKELKQEIKLKDKTIEQLKNQSNNKANTKPELFTCYNCKKSQVFSLLVLELPEGKLCQPCWQVLRKKTKENIKPTITSFTCHNCQQTKKEQSFKVKLDATLTEYSICSTCLPLIKEYNEKEQDSERELDIWE